MLRGYRGQLAKIGLTVLAILGAISSGFWIVGDGLSRDAEYQRQADDRSREYAAYTQKQIRQRCLALSGIPKANCIEEQRHEYRADRRDERDLVAQRKSANWAYIMGAAAVLGMVLSAVGVVLVWITFRETRRTAQVAYDGLELEKANAAAANRPWLIGERVDIGNIEDDGSGEPDAGGIFFHVLMKNFGTRPATKIFMLADIGMSISEADRPHFVTPTIEDHHGFVGPGGSTFSGARAITAKDAEAWKRKQCQLWLYVVAQYGEPGTPGRPYHTEHVYHLYYAGMQNGYDGKPIPVFQARAVGPNTMA